MFVHFLLSFCCFFTHSAPIMYNKRRTNERTPQQGAIKPETTGGGVVAGWLVEKFPTHCRHFCPHFFFFFLQTKPSHIYNAVAHESLSCSLLGQPNRMTNIPKSTPQHGCICTGQDMPWWTSSSGMSSISLCGWNIFCGCYVYDSPWFLLSFIEFYSIIIKFIYSPIRKDRNEATTGWLTRKEWMAVSMWLYVGLSLISVTIAGPRIISIRSPWCSAVHRSVESFTSSSVLAQDDMSNKFIDIYISGGAVMAPSNLLQSVRGRLSSSQHFICCCPRLGVGETFITKSDSFVFFYSAPLLSTLADIIRWQ